MTSIYQYLNSLITPLAPGGVFLGRVAPVPATTYIIVEETFDTEDKAFFTGGRTAGEPTGLSSFLLSVNLFGDTGKDYPKLTELYKKVKEEPPMLVDSHPGLVFAGLSVAPGSMRPSFNSAVDRAYAVVRFNLSYYS